MRGTDLTGAIFSPCRRYRYTLWRSWSQEPPALFLLLNPSDADEVENDPTVTRCQTRAKAMGYGGLVVCNAFAFATKDPDVMLAQADPVGPENDRHILEQVSQAGIVICGWGPTAAHLGRSEHLRRLLTSAGVVPHCLIKTKGGYPGHPLYLSYALLPKPW